MTYSVWVAGEDPEAEEKALVKRIYKATSDAAIINAVDDWVHPEKAAARRKFLQQIPFRGSGRFRRRLRKAARPGLGWEIPLDAAQRASKPDPEQKP